MGMALPDGIAFAFNPPAILGLGQAGGFEVYVQGRTEPDPMKLAQVTQDFITALGRHPALTGLNTFYRPTVPQLRVEVDREKALALGVPVNEVFAALQAQMGSLYKAGDQVIVDNLMKLRPGAPVTPQAPAASAAAASAPASGN